MEKSDATQSVAEYLRQRAIEYHPLEEIQGAPLLRDVSLIRKTNNDTGSNKKNRNMTKTSSATAIACLSD